MNESEGTVLLATSVWRGLKCVETFAKSHQHRRTIRMLFQRILSVKTKFQDTFGAPPEGASADRGRLWPIISEGDCVPGELLLEDDIRVKLGRYYYRLRYSLQDAKRVLDDITSILGAGGNEGGDLVSGTLDPAAGARDPSARTLVLERLAGELKMHINDAITFRKSAPCPRTAPGCSWISWLSGPAIAPAVILKNFFTSLIPSCYSEQSRSNPSTASTIQCALSKSETNPTTLTELYNVLSRELGCRCHFAHLGLCSASVDPSESGSSLKELGSPGSICSLFVTLDLSTLMASYVDKDPLYFKISRPRSGDGNGAQPTSPLPQSPTGHSTSCSRITTSPLGSKHSLRCEAPSRTKFLIESTRPPPAGAPSKSPTYKPVLTLRDILAPHFQEGNTMSWEEDRLRLAAKLARWVRLHYDTPWLGDLDPQKICFFRRYENNPNYANWTPYISVSFERPSDPCGKNNGGLYALGLVLLELGLSKPPHHSPDDDDRAWAVRIASRDLLCTLGKRYQRIVEQLLAEGGEAGRMEGKQIDELESKIMSIIQSLNRK
ncbi:unnamed protein product [Tuber aestivum]|uniref:DUF7580 domain-containing protein n=1 Tax=Tuber aestivum TaxID=59557 RepID=A0A292PTW8_9PEZI|nr:unnamed protein product [Tuber aestivum]